MKTTFEFPKFQIRTESITLKCDRPGCPHNESIELSPKLIGKPCPLCGADLLTAEDYAATVSQLELFAALNIVAKPHAGAKLVEGSRISINPHAGVLNIEIHEKNNRRAKKKR